MRLLGIIALILVILSLMFWLISWAYFTFAAVSLGYDSPFRYVAQGCSVLHTITELLAIAVLSIGLIMNAKQSVQKQ